MPEQEQRPFAPRLSRRELLRSAALGGGGLLGAYLLACGGGKKKSTATPTAGITATPQISRPTPSTLAWHQVEAKGTGPNGAEFPAARHDHSLVTDGQKLYLFGGRNPNTLDDLWAFDIATSQWNNKLQSNDGPPGRFGHNAIWDANRARMVIFGGQNGSDFYNDFWAFDPATGEWSRFSLFGNLPTPQARYGAGGAFDEAGHLLITHGFTTQGRFDDTWQYDLAAQTWTDISPADTRPIKRCLMRAVWDSHKSQLLIFGGQTNGTPFLGDLWSFAIGLWTELLRVPAPAPRTFYAMVFHDAGARAILFGGNTQSGPVNDLWAFHSSGENWTQISTTGTPPSARYGHDAAIASQKPSIYIFGGTDGKTDFNDLWELSV